MTGKSEDILLNLRPGSRSTERTEGAAQRRGLIVGVQGAAATARNIGFAHADLHPVVKAPSSEFVRYDGESHLMTFGVTGSGKTAGPVISNALDHPGSLISLECKGDVYAATAGARRRMGQEVAVLDLSGKMPVTDSFNPFDGLAKLGGDRSITARSGAAAIVPREGGREPFWRNWDENMLTACIAYVMTRVPPERCNFAEIFDMLNNDDVVYNLAVLLDNNVGKLDRSTYAAFSGFLQLSERETRPSVLGSTQQHLMLWESDFIRKITSHTSFDLDGLIAGKPVSLYIIVPPLRLAAYAPLLRLWLTSLLTALMTRERRPKERTLMLCDELGALGKVDAFVTASTLLRSSGLQLWSFWQNPAQLEIYGHDAKTLVDNAGVLQFLGAKNYRMASEFAALIGGISPDQIMNMSGDEQLVMMDGRAPDILKRLRYFEHSDLMKLALAGR